MVLRVNIIWPIILLIIGILMAWPFIGPVLGWSSSENVTKEGWQIGKCSRVIDGDTIVVEVQGVSYTVKYLGAEAPFPGDALRPSEVLAKEATAKNKELVASRQVYLEGDINDLDMQGRYMRYVRTNVGSIMMPRIVMVNEEMIKNGLARSVTMGANDKYQKTLDAAEKYAKERKLGLWSIIK